MNRRLVRHLLLPIHERLFRRPTFRLVRQLEQTQWLPPDQLRAMQLTRLNELLATALQHTDYGPLAGIDPSFQARSLDDLRTLPIIDKPFINRHREQLVNRQVPGGPIPYRTGGSTGTPLVFYLDRRRQAWDKAARIRTHRWWGIQPGYREAYLWNSPVELSRQDRLKNLRDWLMNDLLLPASDLSADSLPRYLRRLRRFRPDCLFGYPSSLCQLADMARRAGADLRGAAGRVIFTTAELLHPHQRRLLQDTFGVDVADGYGSREAGFIAHQCPAGRMHLTSENMIVEFLDQDDQPAPPGVDAQIVVTQLDNHAMPFIRYRTGDTGQRSAERCPCGRGLELMHMVRGRSNDLLQTPDGRWLHGSALSAVVARYGGISAFQFRQRADLSVQLLLVTGADLPAETLDGLRRALLERIGPGARLDISRTDSIPALASGKLQYLVSEATAAAATSPSTALTTEAKESDA